MIRLAVVYNDALDQCTQTGGANIDEVMAFFADDAVRTAVGRAASPGERQIGWHHGLHPAGQAIGIGLVRSR